MSDLTAAMAGTKHFESEAGCTAHSRTALASFLQVLDCSSVPVLASVLWFLGEEGTGKGGLCQALALWWDLLSLPCFQAAVWC